MYGAYKREFCEKSSILRFNNSSLNTNQAK